MWVKHAAAVLDLQVDCQWQYLSVQSAWSQWFGHVCRFLPQWLRYIVKQELIIPSKVGENFGRVHIIRASRRNHDRWSYFLGNQYSGRVFMRFQQADVMTCADIRLGRSTSAGLASYVTNKILQHVF